MCEIYAMQEISCYGYL